MPHESVTDDYVAELESGFLAEAERVKAAPDWAETQKRIVTGTHAYLVALGRVKEGWSREDIDRELGVRSFFGKIPNPLTVIGGNEKPDRDY
jgi:hypothetical protein